MLISLEMPIFRPRKIPCTVPGCRRAFKNTSGLTQHLGAFHSTLPTTTGNVQPPSNDSPPQSPGHREWPSPRRFHTPPSARSSCSRSPHTSTSRPSPRPQSSHSSQASCNLHSPSLGTTTVHPQLNSTVSTTLCSCQSSDRIVNIENAL